MYHQDTLRGEPARSAPAKNPPVLPATHVVSRSIKAKHLDGPLHPGEVLLRLSVSSELDVEEPEELPPGS